MFESLLAVVATMGSPTTSPAAPLVAVATVVVADEIEATDELPSLAYLALLPDRETARQCWLQGCRHLERIESARSVGAVNLDAARSEAEFRVRVWGLIDDALGPGSWWTWEGPVTPTQYRRLKLGQLRDAVGDAVFFAGAWPAPSPLIPRLEVR